MLRNVRSGGPMKKGENLFFKMMFFCFVGVATNWISDLTSFLFHIFNRGWTVPTFFIATQILE